MSDTRRIAEQLEKTFSGEAWHGPSLQDVLRGVSARQATARPLPGAHSIWEIVLHIAAWEDVARKRIENWTAVRPSSQEDWPELRIINDDSWKETLDDLLEANRALQNLILKLDGNQLQKIVPGENYSVEFMLYGVVQHNLYHAGQIALLKKAWF